MANDSSAGEVIPNVVCTGCGLLCDDIFAKFEDGTFKQGVNACNRGWKKLQYYLNELAPLECQRRPNKQGGENFACEDALGEAADMLKRAKSPLFYGFASSSLEDQQAVFELATALGGQIGGPIFAALNAFYESSTQVPLYTGTLGEVINKADVFIFWNADPLESHPRLLSKVIYSRGFFRITGYEIKKYIVIHPSEPEKFRGTTLGIKLQPSEEINLISALSDSIAAGTPAEPPVGVDTSAYKKLVSLLIDAEYAVFFLDKGIFAREDKAEVINALKGLVADLSQKERAMILPLSEDLNSMGLFQHTLAAGMFPLPEVSWDQIDAIVVGGVEETTNLPEELISVCKTVPLIFFPQEEMALAKSADLVIPVSAPGITSGGTATRLDGVSIPLKKIAEPKTPAPTMLQAITEIKSRLFP
jgi:formylmethanofuran dehydrogenase subunit B